MIDEDTFGRNSRERFHTLTVVAALGATSSKILASWILIQGTCLAFLTSAASLRTAPDNTYPLDFELTTHCPPDFFAGWGGGGRGVQGLLSCSTLEAYPMSFGCGPFSWCFLVSLVRRLSSTMIRRFAQFAMFVSQEGLIVGHLLSEIVRK